MITNKTALKRILALSLAVMLLIISCCSCGRKQEEQKGKNTPEPTRSDTQKDDPDYDPDEDIYVYPTGDWGEGFNYGTVRGRWRGEVKAEMEDAHGVDRKDVKRLVTILKAMDMEPPKITYKVMMRFIDESHMEGRVTVDTTAIYDMVLEMYGTEDGIKRLYGALFGLSKNEVAYLIKQSGTTIEEVAAQVSQALEKEAGDKSAFVASKDIAGTYVFDGNMILFTDLDMDLEYDTASGRLTIHVKNPEESEYSNLDGVIVTKG